MENWALFPTRTTSTKKERKIICEHIDCMNIHDAKNHEKMNQRSLACFFCLLGTDAECFFLLEMNKQKIIHKNHFYVHCSSFIFPINIHIRINQPSAWSRTAIFWFLLFCFSLDSNSLPYYCGMPEEKNKNNWAKMTAFLWIDTSTPTHHIQV